jgi:hypothetical protein
MRRTNIYLSDRQTTHLRQLAERRGEPVAVLVREAVDAWLKSQNIREIDEDEWRRRFEELLERRRRLAQKRDWDEAQVERDVMEAVREVRRARSARGR